VVDYNSTTEALSLQPIFGEGIDLFINIFITSFIFINQRLSVT